MTFGVEVVAVTEAAANGTRRRRSTRRRRRCLVGSGQAVAELPGSCSGSSGCRSSSVLVIAIAVVAGRAGGWAGSADPPGRRRCPPTAAAVRRRRPDRASRSDRTARARLAGRCARVRRVAAHGTILADDRAGRAIRPDRRRATPAGGRRSSPRAARRCARRVSSRSSRRARRGSSTSGPGPGRSRSRRSGAGRRSDVTGDRRLVRDDRQGRGARGGSPALAGRARAPRDAGSPSPTISGSTDGSFDVAVSSFVLQLVPNRFRALREVRRVLRRGGTLAWISWLAGSTGCAAGRRLRRRPRRRRRGGRDWSRRAGTTTCATSDRPIAQMRRAGYARGDGDAGGSLEHPFDVDGDVGVPHRVRRGRPRHEPRRRRAGASRRRCDGASPRRPADELALAQPHGRRGAGRPTLSDVQAQGSVAALGSSEDPPPSADLAEPAGLALGTLGALALGPSATTGSGSSSTRGAWTLATISSGSVSSVTSDGDRQVGDLDDRVEVDERVDRVLDRLRQVIRQRLDPDVLDRVEERAAVVLDRPSTCRSRRAGRRPSAPRSSGRGTGRRGAAGG